MASLKKVIAQERASARRGAMRIADKSKRVASMRGQRVLRKIVQRGKSALQKSTFGRGVIKSLVAAAR